MSKLLFVLWMLLYPITCGINGYLYARKREIYCLPKFTEGELMFVGLLEIAIYVFVASALWRLP